MIAPPVPAGEAERVATLQSYDVLDTVCETAFDNIVELAAMLTDSPISLVSLIDSERQWFKARFGLDVAQTEREVSFCAHAIMHPEEALVVPDALLDPRFADNPLVTGPLGIRFYAGIPLVNPEGAALGTLCIIDQKPRDMDEGQRKILKRLAETVMTTLELRRAMNRVHEFSLLDFLTRLPNRAALVDAIAKAIGRRARHDTPFGVVYLDLDGFKAVNDRLGHATGDQVLIEVAAALRRVLRVEDVAARLGGDEFAIVIEGDNVAVASACARFRAELATGMRAKGWSITASMGAASFTTAPASVDEALAVADGLMYEAKAAGKNRVVSGSFGDSMELLSPFDAARPAFARTLHA